MSYPKATTMPGSNLLLPVKLDAFILNKEVCNGKAKESKIAPITQPNYTYLRIDQNAARTDVLPHVDLHLSSPATTNPRITNLSTRETRPERQGVYLHWTIPKLYRSGASIADDKNKTSAKDKTPGKDETPATEANGDPTAPVFPLVPNRWLVVRSIRAKSAMPPETNIPAVEAWVIESDRLRRIGELHEDIDLQTDVSPFMDVNVKSLDADGHEKGGTPSSGTGGGIGDVSISDQAEIFIGSKTPLSEWKEDSNAKRVKLHVLASSNPLFADYQPHNGNVFSMLDTFGYNQVKDQDGRVVSRDRLSKATADYYVIGWHSNDKDDVLYTTAGVERRERLAKLSLLLSEKLADSTEWLGDKADARIVCHGAMYGVQWDATTKPRTPADDWSANLIGSKQVAVGTSPVDALLAYVRAHHGEKPPEGMKETKETILIRQLEESIFNLSAYLRLQDDSPVDAYRKVTDGLIHRNYTRTNGGIRYNFPISSTPGKPTLPKDTEMEKLRNLNNAQALLDGTMRAAKTQSWELFSLWFKFFSTDPSALPPKPAAVKEVDDRLTLLLSLVEDQKKEVKRCKGELPEAVAAVHHEYEQQGDPTIMVAGVKSGWAHDFLEKVKVRLDSHLPEAPEKGIAKEIDTLEMPAGIKETIPRLLAEFEALQTDATGSKTDNTMPLYHDAEIETDDDQPLWRDRWNNRQPWFPLFVEWEAEYVHVPWAEWSLKKTVSASSGLEHDRYAINPNADLVNIKDRRRVSGRILMLPQPSFALEALIQQLFNTVPANELNEVLSLEKRTELKDNVRRLPFLSAPLSGLTDHLLTLAQGTHIKPNVRVAGQKTQVIMEAVDSDNMFSVERIGRMENEMDPTPYGMQIHVAPGKDDPSPFKPVTHGQLRFTKLNVIDKFGQAIHALQPSSSTARILNDGLIPCTGEFYEVDAKKQGSTDVKEAHTAGEDDKGGFSEFIQLPPTINQPARLNACFVKRQSKKDASSGWRPSTAWESPIWGWIVVNYIDYGIQLFTADGVFYREVRLPGSAAQGRTSAQASTAWLPFKKTDDIKPETVSQLDKLVAKLTGDGGTYIQAFLAMVNGALKFSGAAPGEYAESLNCIVGRPLALVNMGWSLELSTAPYQNQSTMNARPPEISLTAGNSPYEFRVKLGDSHREFDGLVGYFPVKPRSGEEDRKVLLLDDELNLDKLYTYFGHDQKPETPGASYPLQELTGTTYPEFKPYWLDPKNYYIPTSAREKPDDIQKASERYSADSNDKWQVFGAIIDPFQPVHGYSSFLPARELKLPEWTWQQALNHMTAFFHMGPMMVTKDVPEFQGKYELRADYSLTGKQEVFKDSRIELPTNAAEWNWLQPYMRLAEEKKETQESGKKSETQSSDSDPKPKPPPETVFMPIEVGKVDGRPKFENGPYTAVEGYLQMKKGIVEEDIKN